MAGKPFIYDFQLREAWLRALMQSRNAVAVLAGQIGDLPLPPHGTPNSESEPRRPNQSYRGHQQKS
jgi:hypothetical protein